MCCSALVWEDRFLCCRPLTTFTQQHSCIPGVHPKLFPNGELAPTCLGCIGLCYVCWGVRLLVCVVLWPSFNARCRFQPCLSTPCTCMVQFFGFSPENVHAALQKSMQSRSTPQGTNSAPWTTASKAGTSSSPARSRVNQNRYIILHLSSPLICFPVLRHKILIEHLRLWRGCISMGPGLS